MVPLKIFSRSATLQINHVTKQEFILSPPKAHRLNAFAVWIILTVMMSERFNQNSATYPSSYFGEIHREGREWLSDSRERGEHLPLYLLRQSSLSIHTKVFWVFPFVGIREHDRIEPSRTELVWKLNCFVCHHSLSPAPVEHSGFMQQVATQTEGKLIFPCIAFAFYVLDYPRNVNFFVYWTKGFLSEGADYFFRNVHIGEKRRAMGVAHLIAVKLYSTWV